MSILIPDEIDVKQKYGTRDKENHFIIINVSLHQ